MCSRLGSDRLSQRQVRRLITGYASATCGTKGSAICPSGSDTSSRRIWTWPRSPVSRNGSPSHPGGRRHRTDTRCPPLSHPEAWRSSLFTQISRKLRLAQEVASMHGTHERARTMSLRLPRSWLAHVVVVLVLVSCHVVLFYGISQTRAPKSSTDGPPCSGQSSRTSGGTCINAP